ncbi:1-aminocyclopropane-1-carboxylate deaminase/D-cysteine desulfhydrase [Algibacter miyuki]|uniref:1-aminocyclopropane-1-carboxylate deaminase/D-cysteine desulfhydrase n=1 Tax=Algibacter miyuki TaxID=1306933 RepID=A0ABV5H2K2_9FLAO|nr:D-cysteine desulfhydrase family protein [Algibacter miyuki]MDN3664088.1 D-cysteine desulfhydrase family protein [Algibacter miyuki]
MLTNKYPLGFFPTPLEKMNNLSEKYPDYQLFIKRDDNSGLASGGNKVRKLQYLIYEALNKGFDTIITSGAQQSNHCRQTAAACAQAKLECNLLIGGEKPKIYNGNLLLSQLLGAKIHFNGENRKGEDIEGLKIRLEAEGKKVYVVPYGGSNLLGACGFIDAVKELKVQLLEKSLKMDYIFFASSSGGTQAGLRLGGDLFGLQTKLMPISIDKMGYGDKTLAEAVLELLNEGQKSLSIKKAYSIDDAELIHGYDSKGYGVVTPNEKLAIKELAENEGILLDPVYSGRAFYGMLDHIKSQKIEKGANIMFWHTGGLPANFYYSEELLE